MVERFDEYIDIVRIVVDGEAGAARGRDSEPPHEQLRAMMARANRDPVGIDDRADVVRVDTFEGEADRAATVLGARRPMDDEPVDAAQPVHGEPRDLHFVLSNGYHGEVMEVVDGRAESDHVGDVWGASCEL